MLTSVNCRQAHACLPLALLMQTKRRAVKQTGALASQVYADIRKHARACVRLYSSACRRRRVVRLQRARKGESRRPSRAWRYLRSRCLPPQCMHVPGWTLASTASERNIMFRSSLQALLLDSGSALAHHTHAAATSYRSARFQVLCTLHAGDWVRKARAVPDNPDA